MIYECDNCGLCCHRLIVQATVDDVLREPRIEEASPLAKEFRRELTQASWYIAWPGRPCGFLTDGKKCDIYATRPMCCVAFPAGPGKCHDLRDSAGLPMLVPREATASERIAEKYQQECAE